MNADKIHGKSSVFSWQWMPRRMFAHSIHSRFYLRSSAFICGFIVFALSVHAEVTAKDAWVRATVPAQKTTAAYVKLHSTDYARIVEVRTPAAGRAEIHRTEMEKGVMH